MSSSDIVEISGWFGTTENVVLFPVFFCAVLYHGLSEQCSANRALRLLLKKIKTNEPPHVLLANPSSAGCH